MYTSITCGACKETDKERRCGDTDLRLCDSLSLTGRYLRQVLTITLYQRFTNAAIQFTSQTNQALPSRPIVLIEGILLFTDSALVDLMDVKIFVDTDDDIRFIRRLQRDVEERGRTLDGVISQYMTTVRPMHHQFVDPSKRKADIIVPHGLNTGALDLIVCKLRAFLFVNDPNHFSMIENPVDGRANKVK